MLRLELQPKFRLMPSPNAGLALRVEHVNQTSCLGWVCPWAVAEASAVAIVSGGCVWIDRIRAAQRGGRRSMVAEMRPPVKAGRVNPARMADEMAGVMPSGEEKI